ncbi:GNAT family N-acetyltransferase [Paenibacillus agricola]|uniref:GNAT family N-acetyltransferase n=1 Tax=Paenibacillus agricola TaxID=2716264 RepID=A0ABX0JBL4_9BACL|nr:GNAT family N-acetyltransferase [Paenibacillus agricola]NHN32629.1 GNAT family N-acetyltransferase [Paenibacillus agricola]
MNSEEQIRFLRQDEMAAAVALADSVFRTDGRASMGASLPKVFSCSLLQAVGCFSDGVLVSFAGFVPSVVQIGGARISVYSYGAVCTHPTYRGRGHARAILEFAKQQAERAGASLLLVSGELPLYIKAGCCLFGTTGTYRLLSGHLADLASSRSSDLVCREASSADWFRLHQLAAARPVGFEQSLWDIADLMKAEALASIRRLRHRTFIAERSGVPVAFCVFALKPKEYADRSIALASVNAIGGGFAIEWAGEDKAVVSLLLHVMEKEAVQQLEAVIPWQEKSLARLLEPAFLGTGKNQGTVYVLNAKRLFEQLGPYWTGQGVSPGLLPTVRAVEDRMFELSVGERLLPVLNRQQLVSLLFDSEGEEDRSSYEWKRAAGACFPLPFPYTKGLNFI